MKTVSTSVALSFRPLRSVLCGSIAAAVAVVLLGTATETQGQIVGFNQTAGGTYDYNNPGNWANGDINGIWGSDLNVTGDQFLEFGVDTTLADGLFIDHTTTGNGVADLTFRGSGGARTVTLGNNITVSPSSNQTITIGTASAATNLNVAVGGNRVFSVEVSDVLAFYGALTGGNFTATGGGTTKLINTGTATGSTATVIGGSTLNFDSSTSGVAGATRIAAVNLRGGRLTVNGNGTVASTDAVSGEVLIDGNTSREGINYITIAPNSNRNAQLTASALTRANGGVVQISGTNLGNAPANGVANFRLTGPTTPTLIGGNGLAGTTNISILPWAIGGAANNSSSDFITYDTTTGFRPLAATEYVNAIADGATSTDNVKLIGNTTTTTYTLANPTTVNSLYLAAGQSGSGITVAGSPITVTSGAVFLSSPNGGVTVTSKLNFGSAQGVIGYSQGKPTSISVELAEREVSFSTSRPALPI